MKRAKKKALANQKLTIIKILPKDGVITQEELDKWKFLFATGITPEQAEKSGEVKVEYVPASKPGKHYITLVRVGSDNYAPTTEELEQWRCIFEDASKDPNFKIFAHEYVTIETIEVGKIIAVST